jgi:predicted ATPase
MWIKSFRVTNYKSFADSGEHPLARNMNVIVGQNNVGKTALLQAIAQRIEARPHRNSGQRRETSPNPNSRIEIDFIATAQELHDTGMASGWPWIPMPNTYRADPLKFLQIPEQRYSAAYQSGQGGTGWHQWRRPSNNADLGQQPIYVRFAANQEHGNVVVAEVVQGEADTIGPTMASALTRHTYLFNAIRSPAPRSNAGSNPQLSPDAQNLPEVLSTLQPNRTLFEEYVAQVRRVLPLVQWISVDPVGSQVEIRVWNVDDRSGRDDLANPLSECGTGVGQVLAILYVVMRSSGDVICIDEPNSFLHPGAAKTLMAILNEHKKHQYIIATHSPEVIVASHPERLFMLGFGNERTTLRELVQSDIDGVRQMLHEIGSRFSDVFGADAIVWVEGPTEVECFPILLNADEKPIPTGLVIAPLRSTGDLEGRHVKVCADIYRNLSAAGSMLPTNVTISLDGDKSGSASVASLEAVFGKIVRFLPRRMYECYLLHPEALVALLNVLPTFAGGKTTTEAVETWIQANGQAAKYGAADDKPLSTHWTVRVNAAVLLDDLFQTLSGAKEIYRKASHSVWLTQWLLENDPDFMRELRDYVSGLVTD